MEHCFALLDAFDRKRRKKNKLLYFIMTATELFTFLLFELHLNPCLCYITMGRLDLDEIRALPLEEAVEVLEDVADGVLIEATALKLHPIFIEEGVQLTPAMTEHITTLIYMPGFEYPFEKVLASYNNLLMLGAESETFDRALEVAHNVVPPQPISSGRHGFSLSNGISIGSLHYAPLSMSRYGMRGIYEPLSLANMVRSTPQHVLPASTVGSVLSTSTVGSVLSRINHFPRINVMDELYRQQALRIENSGAAISSVIPSTVRFGSNLGSVVIRDVSINGGQVVTMVVLGCTVASLTTICDGFLGYSIQDIISSRVLECTGFVTEPQFIRESLVHVRPSSTVMDIVPYDTSTTTTTGLEIVPYDSSGQPSTSAQPSTTNTTTISSIARCSGSIMLGLMIAWVALGNEGIIDTGVTSSIGEMFDH